MNKYKPTIDVFPTMKDLPTQLAVELGGHQGPVRAVRFNSRSSIALHKLHVRALLIPSTIVNSFY